METMHKLLKWRVRKEKIRLDKFLAEIAKEFSRSSLQRFIEQGRVLVNKKVERSKSAIVSPGDSVNIKYEKSSLQAREDIVLKVLYEDNDVLIIDKPPGLVVHPTPNQDKPSVAAGLIARLEHVAKVGSDKFRPGIVHRLDSDTSGLLVIAKINPAFEYLKNLFKNRKIEKEYLALVHGKIERQHGFFRDPIGRRPKTGKFQTGMGRDALTEYWVKGYYINPPFSKTGNIHSSMIQAGDEMGLNPPFAKGGVDTYTLVRIQLHTGRTHQIRVHFSSAGFPVVGDKLYGGQHKKTDSKIFPRQFLHARYLKLKLPNGNVKEFESPLPRDLTNSLENFKSINLLSRPTSRDPVASK